MTKSDGIKSVKENDNWVDDDYSKPGLNQHIREKARENAEKMDKLRQKEKEKYKEDFNKAL